MIAADDPRHGRRAGFVAGCEDACCRKADRAYAKASKYRRHVEGSQFVDVAPVLDRLAWWADRGVVAGPLARAAHLGNGTLAELVAGHRDVCLRSTARAVLAVTWTHVDDRATCNPDLTRARLRSLMAAGHKLDWILENLSVPLTNRWRKTSRIHVGTARAVAALYRAAPLAGDSTMSKGKALKAGHVHPLAWDDPGTPAEPSDWVAAALHPRVTRLRDVVDDNVITRILDGDYRLHATPAERAEVCRRWAELGRSLNDLSRLTGWRPVRYYRVREVA